MPVDAFGRQVTCVHCGGAFRSTADVVREDALVDQPALPEVPLSLLAGVFPRPRIRES
jgi:hypothetical protein